MRFTVFLPLLAALPAAFAAVKKDAALDVDVSCKFPDTNPWNRVRNGVSTNLIHVRLDNHAGEDITVTSVRGEFWSSGLRKDKLLRKTTELALKQPVYSGQKSPLIPYRFHSENKIGEVALRVYVDFLDSKNKKHSVLSFDDKVTIVEPKGSWFDPALLFAYAVCAALVYFVGSLLFSSYNAQLNPRAKGNNAKAALTKAATAVTAPGPGGASTAVAPEKNEWIDERHLKVRGVKKGGAGSGSESEGAKKK